MTYIHTAHIFVSATTCLCHVTSLGCCPVWHKGCQTDTNQQWIINASLSVRQTYMSDRHVSERHDLCLSDTLCTTPEIVSSGEFCCKPNTDLISLSTWISLTGDFSGFQPSKSTHTLEATTDWHPATTHYIDKHGRMPMIALRILRDQNHCFKWACSNLFKPHVFRH